MKKWTTLTSVAVIALAAAFSAKAQTTLSEILFNEDGTPTDLFPSSSSPISAPGVTVTSGFGNSSQSPYLSGLGTLKYTVSGAGAHTFIGFVDDEADFNNGPFNDYGFVSGGSTPSYLTWQIDIPSTLGTLAYNNGPLLNENNVPNGNNDVSFALGFGFNLGAGQVATIDLSLTSAAPGGSYIYLADQNNISGESVYYSGSLTITSPVHGVPDNGATWISMLLGLTGLAVMMGFERKFSQKRAA
jgi:hypothetical protein